MSRRIIVSDLHVDTWTYRKIGNTGKAMHEHFFDLLDWCEKKQITEFIINGDIMDMPPYEGQCVFSEGPCIARDVASRLVDFAARVPVTYIFGNHDIGVSGFRATADRSIPQLKNTNFCYPDYTLQYPSITILIEHGHMHDPALMLYVNDLSARTDKKSGLQAFQWAMQRRDPGKGTRRGEPGALTPIAIRPGETAFTAVRRSEREMKGPSLIDKAKNLLYRLFRRQVTDWTMHNWRHAARDRMRAYVKDLGDTAPPPVIYQILGHTHLPDVAERMTIRKDVLGTYVNAGSWMGDGNAGWYLDVREDGKVWLQEWISEPPEVKRLYQG